ncbi:MAG TPA: glycosyltransferase [Phycisphaerales bacterium]|nr:glycosyltransferase [Phycisphaerales bacterium]
MRIVHAELTMRLADGGVVVAVMDLCREFAARGHDVTLLACDDTDVPDAWRAGAPESPRLLKLDPPALPLGLFSPRQLRAARDAIAGADVLHLHGAWTPSNVQFAALARHTGVPYVVSIHGMLDDWCMAQKHLKKTLHLALAGRRTLERAGAVHCTAAAELEQSRERFPRARAAVIPLFLDLDPFRDPPGPEDARAAFEALRNEGAHILFLSRLHPKKGLELLIDAADLLRARGRDCTLIVAGSGDPAYERSLLERVRGLGLDDRVCFVGFVGGRAKISLLQACDLFVLPSSQENFGYVLFEAMAAGTPVIASRLIDTWPELLESGGADVVDRDPRAIADAIAGLLDDPARRAAMGRAGREWVTRNLNPDAVVARFESLYAELAATARRTEPR